LERKEKECEKEQLKGQTFLCLRERPPDKMDVEATLYSTFKGLEGTGRDGHSQASL